MNKLLKRTGNNTFQSKVTLKNNVLFPPRNIMHSALSVVAEKEAWLTWEHHKAIRNSMKLHPNENFSVKLVNLNGFCIEDTRIGIAKRHQGVFCLIFCVVFLTLLMQDTPYN